MSYLLVLLESRGKQNVMNCTTAQVSTKKVDQGDSTALPCALYIAPSNLLGTRSAWFAGVDFHKRDLIGIPNVVVTMIDHPWQDWSILQRYMDYPWHEARNLRDHMDMAGTNKNFQHALIEPHHRIDIFSPSLLVSEDVCHHVSNN